MYKISKLKEFDLSALTKLLDSSFKIQSKHKNAPITWKYFSHLKQFPVYALVAKFNKSIVSFYSNKIIPVRYTTHLYKSGTCLDMSTDVNHRRKGLIKTLSNQIYKANEVKNQPFSFGFSNSHGVTVDKNYKKYGYTVVGKFYNIFTTIFSLTKKNKLNYFLKRVYQIKKENSNFDNYFQIDPSIEYLQWRYFDKPEANYLVYELHSNKEFLGHIIVKKGKYQLNILKITANMNTLDFDELLYLLRKLAIKNHKLLLNFFVLKNNFWKNKFKNKFTLSTNSPDYYLTIKPNNITQIEKKEILDVQNWLCMSGDII